MPPHALRRLFFPAARRAVALAALVSLSMCNLDHVDFSAGGKASIPHGTLVGSLLGGLAFTGFDDVDFSEQFQNQGVTKGEVSSVHLKSFTLTIDAPADGDFDFIDSVAFFAEADGVDKVQIASMDSIPKGKKELDLIINTDAELEPFVVAPSMTISSQVQGMQPSEDTTVTAAAVLDVEVHIPGCN